MHGLPEQPLAGAATAERRGVPLPLPPAPRGSARTSASWVPATAPSMMVGRLPNWPLAQNPSCGGGLSSKMAAWRAGGAARLAAAAGQAAPRWRLAPGAAAACTCSTAGAIASRALHLQDALCVVRRLDSQVLQ